MTLRSALLASMSVVIFASAARAQEVEEIVVTAQKRSESLQKVPIAVTAITADAIAKAGIKNSEDVALAVPSLTVTRETTGIQLFLRGIGTQSSQVGQEPAIAVFIDGVYQSSASSGTFQLNNIERLEVLKGPQGTLYGRNATGGAINVITKTPSYTPGLEAEVGYGNKNTLYGTFYGTTGITDKVAIDLAGAIRDQKDGFGTNVTTGHDVNKARDTALRSKLLLELFDTTRIILAGDYSETKGSIGMAQRPGDANGNPILGLGYYDTRGGFDSKLFVKNYGGSARIEQDLGFAKLVSLTAYRKVRAFQDGDLDLTPAPIVEYPLTEKTHQFTQELNLSGDTGKLKWIIGGFYLDASSDYDPFQLIGVGACGCTNPANGVYIRASQKTKSYAGFGQATYEIFEGTNLTLGARYTSDKKSATADFGLVSGFTAGNTGNPTYTHLYDYVPASKTFSKFTYRVALDHQISDAAMVYGSVSRGFKSGLFNLIELGATQFSAAVKPEVLDAYELGLKSSLFDRRIRFNISGFLYKYKNIQASIIANAGTVLLNAAKTTIYGLDFDSDIAVSKDLTAHFGLGWLPHAKYNSFQNAPYFHTDTLLTTPAIDASGNRVVRTPKFTFNAQLNHEMDLAGGKLDSSVTYAYNSGWQWQPDNQFSQSSYSLVNGQIKWTAPGGHYSVRLFANNLFNEHYISQLSEVQGFGLTYSPAMGRTFGGAVGVKF